MSNHAFEKSVDGQGLYDITAQVSSAVASSGVQDGLATVFIQHTSASLLVQDTHTEEGPDDMPAHIKGALTAVQVGVPVMQGKLALGVWQGVYLWEHRHSARTRSIVVNVMGD